MGATTHDVAIGTDTVTKTYVRWDREEPEREWAALSLLAEHAPGLAPTPLSRGTEPPSLTMTRLPGAEPSGPLTPAQTWAFGAALRRMYDVPLPDDLPERRFGTSLWADNVRAWAEESIAPPGVVDDALTAARDWLDATTAPEPGRRVLGLADGNLANVLLDHDRCRLVDFEAAGVSDVAFEVADVLEHLSGRLPGWLDEPAFLDAVGLDATERARVSAYRPSYAAFWLLMLLPGNPAHHRNPPGTLENQARHVLHLLA